MSKSNGSANGHATTSPLDSVDITVEAFIGESKMTLAELSALNLDSLVTLNSSLSSQIDIRLNGVSVASGELVAVGDHFGVRIKSVAKDMKKRD